MKKNAQVAQDQAAAEKSLLLLQLEQCKKDTELLKLVMESERVAREEAIKK